MTTEKLKEIEEQGYRPGIDLLKVYTCQFCGEEAWFVVPYWFQKPDVRKELLDIVLDEKNDIKVQVEAIRMMSLTASMMRMFDKESQQAIDAVDNNEQWNMPKHLQCKCK